MNPFDVVTTLSHTKKPIIDSSNENDYNAFMINRAFSYYPDTIMHAQEMNSHHHLDRLLQHDYYLHSVRPKKRFSKWFKKEQDDTVDLVASYYTCSPRRAREYMRVLTKEQIKKIREVMTNGTE